MQRQNDMVMPDQK